MKLLSKFFWSGLIAFLACFALGLYFCNSDSDISTACLLFSLPSAALMLLSMVAMDASRGDESRAQHASYCLHCARNLAQEMRHWLEHNQPGLDEARLYTALLLRAGATFKYFCSQPLSGERQAQLSQLHDKLELLFGETFSRAEQTIEHLRSHLKAMSALAETIDEMTALSRQAYSARGTYRNGPAPAGQVLYGDQIEPQQEVVMLSNALTRAVAESRETLQQLEAALASARPAFLKYRHFLTETHSAG